MFRFSLLLCASLVVAITAKPHKPWAKPKDEAFQDTVMSVDASGKLVWTKEVEPAEDMDVTQDDIDPRMRIWKSVGEVDKQLSKAAPEEPQEDMDEVYHQAREQLYPYLAPLTAEYKETLQAVYFRPEVDEDALYHREEPAAPVQEMPLAQEVKSGVEVRVHLKPEEDMDDVYHADVQQLIRSGDDAEAAAPADVPAERKYSEPEEDLDDLYHQ